MMRYYLIKQKCNNLCGNFEALTCLLLERENFLTQDSEKSNNKKTIYKRITKEKEDKEKYKT